MRIDKIIMRHPSKLIGSKTKPRYLTLADGCNGNSLKKARGKVLYLLLVKTTDLLLLGVVSNETNDNDSDKTPRAEFKLVVDLSSDFVFE